MHVFRTVNGLDFPNVTKKRTLNKQSKKLPEKKNKTTKKFQHSRLSQYPELAVSILGRLAIAANKLITSMWSVCRSSLAAGRPAVWRRAGSPASGNRSTTRAFVTELTDKILSGMAAMAHPDDRHEI